MKFLLKTHSKKNGCAASCAIIILYRGYYRGLTHLSQRYRDFKLCNTNTQSSQTHAYVRSSYKSIEVLKKYRRRVQARARTQQFFQIYSRRWMLCFKERTKPYTQNISQCIFKIFQYCFSRDSALRSKIVFRSRDKRKVAPIYNKIVWAKLPLYLFEITSR